MRRRVFAVLALLILLPAATAHHREGHSKGGAGGSDPTPPPEPGAVTPPLYLRGEGSDAYLSPQAPDALVARSSTLDDATMGWYYDGTLTSLDNHFYAHIHGSMKHVGTEFPSMGQGRSCLLYWGFECGLHNPFGPIEWGGMEYRAAASITYFENGKVVAIDTDSFGAWSYALRDLPVTGEREMTFLFSAPPVHDSLLLEVDFGSVRWDGDGVKSCIRPGTEGC